MDSNIRVYWDRICIADGCFDVNWFEELSDLIEKNNSSEIGIVNNTDPSETSYTAHVGNWNKYKDWFDYIVDLKLFPILPDHETHWFFRVHKMEVGGKMAEHCDGNFSLAVSIYLSECEGGELCIRGEDSILVSPKVGRMVVLKCDTLHSVLPVKQGIRKSIQLFVKFESKE